MRYDKLFDSDEINILKEELKFYNHESFPSNFRFVSKLEEHELFISNLSDKNSKQRIIKCSFDIWFINDFNNIKSVVFRSFERFYNFMMFQYMKD